MIMVLYLSSNQDILLLFLLFITKEIKQHILNVGLNLLLELLGSTNLKQQQDASVALYKLAKKSLTLCSIDAGSPSPAP